MTDEVTQKNCVVCKKAFTINDFTKEELHKKPFELRRRCKDCRYNFNYKSNPNYDKERYQKKKAGIIVSGVEENWARLAIAIQRESRGSLIPYHEQIILEEEVREGVISPRDKYRLKEHYESVVFMLSIHITIPHYPFHSLYDLDREILKRVFF